MRDLVVLLLLGFASALVPLINIEAYLAVHQAVVGTDAIWALALSSAVGQILGKLIWYQLGASSLDWGWVRRRVETPKALARLEIWRRRTHERPGVAGALVLLSALVGLPPFALLAVLAGQLRMNLTIFVVLGLLGRWMRFLVILGGVSWVSGSKIF